MSEPCKHRAEFILLDDTGMCKKPFDFHSFVGVDEMPCEKPISHDGECGQAERKFICTACREQQAELEFT